MEQTEALLDVQTAVGQTVGEDVVYVSAVAGTV